MAFPIPRQTIPQGRQDFTFYQTTKTASGHWWPIYPSHAQKLGLRSASSLSYLLNVSKFNADEKGWVYATPQFIQNGTGLPDAMQEAMLNRLGDDGFVEVQFRSLGRFIKVNLAKVRKLDSEH
jgi:hypothetical protein